MEWLSQNWAWVLLGVGFIAMHLFGHGGHRGRHEENPAGEDGKQPGSAPGPGHRH